MYDEFHVPDHVLIVLLLACVASISNRVIPHFCSRPKFLDELMRKRRLCCFTCEDSQD